MPPIESNRDSWRLFRTCRALKALRQPALREMFAAAEERTFEPGDVIVRQGDRADGLVILLDGEAHAWLRTAEADHQIGSVAGGEVVGEMALVTREPRMASVVADTRVRALVLPMAVFDELAHRQPRLAMVLTELVADRLGRKTHDGFGGKNVEGFRILKCVGRGGMSVVYRARDESTGDLVALKMMSYRLIYDDAALARFRREADLLQGLEHENIARLKRLFPAYQTYFLVLELCDGVDLRRLVNARGPLPEPEVRGILGQLARALEHVHDRGLVHRDLKPANVMITRDGLVKLTDFGVAMPTGRPDTKSETEDHVVFGTPPFMAPEQLSGGTIDARTDIYALACVAYELLTGHHLFGASDLVDLVEQKMTLRLPPRNEIGDGISAELYDFLDSALRVNPNERLASVASLVPWAAPGESA